MQDDRAEEAYYRDKPLHDEINRLKAELVSMRKVLRVVPDGWKLVPIEPTEAMNEAGRYEDGRNTAIVVWEEMVAAAPTPTSRKSSSVGWISVDDRLPEYEEWVAVLVKGQYADCAERRDSRIYPGTYPYYWMTPGSVELSHVTHWCALPPLPDNVRGE